MLDVQRHLRINWPIYVIIIGFWVLTTLIYVLMAGGADLGGECHPR